MTGGIDIATNVRRCRDHSRIASVQLFNASIDVHLARSGPAPGEKHRIYSVDLAPLSPERDLWRCWRRRAAPAGIGTDHPVTKKSIALDGGYWNIIRSEERRVGKEHVLV